MGKVILAYLPEPEVEKVLKQYPLIRMTSKTITQKPHLLEHLAAVREQGVAFDLGENVDGVLCVAGPIFDQHGRAVAGVSVSGPTSRMESKLMAIRDDVRNAGVKISRMLGPLSASEGAAARIAASFSEATAHPPTPTE